MSSPRAPRPPTGRRRRAGARDTISVHAPGDIDIEGLRVFLGGAIDMGSGVNWQADAVQALAHRPGLVLLNPRREDFDEADLDEQIAWELTAMEAADHILMWFPASAMAPISLLETGLHLRSGKLVLGAAADYPRRRNLELTAARYGISIAASLDDLVAFIGAQHDQR